MGSNIIKIDEYKAETEKNEKQLMFDIWEKIKTSFELENSPLKDLLSEKNSYAVIRTILANRTLLEAAFLKYDSLVSMYAITGVENGPCGKTEEKAKEGLLKRSDLIPLIKKLKDENPEKYSIFASGELLKTSPAFIDALNIYCTRDQMIYIREYLFADDKKDVIEHRSKVLATRLEGIASLSVDQITEIREFFVTALYLDSPKIKAISSLSVPQITMIREFLIRENVTHEMIEKISELTDSQVKVAPYLVKEKAPVIDLYVTAFHKNSEKMIEVLSHFHPYLLSLIDPILLLENNPSDEKISALRDLSKEEAIALQNKSMNFLETSSVEEIKMALEAYQQQMKQYALDNETEAEKSEKEEIEKKKEYINENLRHLDIRGERHLNMSLLDYPLDVLEQLRKISKERFVDIENSDYLLKEGAVDFVKEICSIPDDEWEALHNSLFIDPTVLDEIFFLKSYEEYKRYRAEYQNSGVENLKMEF